jgi:tetratricopeptide (TPR) repeat protein
MQTTLERNNQSYHQDPLFHEALRLFQSGAWESGQAVLARLQEKFPLESDLRRLRQEMLLRSRIDIDEQEDRVRTMRRRILTLAVRLAILAAVVLGGLVAFRLYANWIQESWAVASENLSRELAKVELAARFRDAQELLRSGRTDAALALLNQISAQDAQYPGLQETITQAQRAQDLERRYFQAMGLVEAGDTQNAMAILKDIYAEEPYFKDVKLQIENIENEFLLGDLLEQADAAYTAAQWETAISGYETVRALNADFKADHVESRLFESFLNAANERLVKEPDSLTAMDVAQSYYRKALALRPGNERIKAEQDAARQTIEARLVKSYVEAAQAAIASQGDSLEALQSAKEYILKALKIYPEDAELKMQNTLAAAYLRAQDSFAKGRWFDVIDSLEIVYKEDPAYASGTACQTLYEAYMQAGNFEESGGNFETALDYFPQRGQSGGTERAGLPRPLRSPGACGTYSGKPG